MQLSGSGSDTSVTSSGGLYAFPGLATGTDWSVAGSFAASQGTAISAIDASVAINAAVGNISYGPEQFLAMDVNGSHSLTAIDASLILQWRTGLIPQLPVHAASRCNSLWILTPFAQTVPDQILTFARPWVLPCQHGAVSFQPLSGPAQNQDFRLVLFGDSNGSWMPAAGGGGHVPSSVSGRARTGAALRTRNGEVRIPLSIESHAAWQAAEVVLRYDARRLRPRGVRRLAGNADTLLVANLKTPGIIRLALARKDPSMAAAPLMLLFRGAGTPRAPVEVLWSQIEAP
jgi:hypothetical protein